MASDADPKLLTREIVTNWLKEVKGSDCHDFEALCADWLRMEAEIKTLIDVALAAETLVEDLREEASLTAESSGSHHELMNRLYVLKETR